LGGLRSGFYPLPSLELGFVSLAGGHGIHDSVEHLFAIYPGGLGGQDGAQQFQ
jgi:hypothetical protein